MSISHLLIIIVPSFVAGLILGRSFLTGVFWGLVAEVIGLLLVALPISAGGTHRGGLSLSMVALSIAFGMIAGSLGFATLRLLRSK